MKQCILFILFFGISFVSSQAQQKIAYIDSEFILSKIPEYNGIGERLNVISGQWKKEIDEYQKEVDELQKDFDAKSILYTEEVKLQKKKEIDLKIQKLDQFKTSKYGPNGEYFKRQQELIEPLQQRILDAVNKIATRDNYDFIFDRTGDYLFLFTKSQWNVSEEVLLELGIEIEPTN